jgi:hypothetical protein
VHDYQINVLNENLEGAKALELKSMDVFLCTKVDKVCIYDSLTFKELGNVPITLLQTETREPN